MGKESNIRIAIIDDHDLLREGICKFLEDYGFETVFKAENGQLAIEKMEACENIPDLCIVDLYMPVMDGFETTKVLRAKYPELKILVFSVNDDEKDITTMLEHGADGYVLKGADPEELKRAIQDICNGKKYFSAGIREIVQKFFTKSGK